MLGLCTLLLKSHWVLVVMDQYTRRIIGFAVHVGDVDGVMLCRMFIGCSRDNRFHGISAPTMNGCFDFTDGKPTCGYWTSNP